MKILIVDDSKSMRMLVALHLQRAGFKGHTIIEAENGALGLNVAVEQQPDLVISDWNMPEMSGLELLQALNSQHTAKQIPKMPSFVFVTSESTEDMLKIATENGAHCLITKPFSVDVFEAKLATIIQ